MDRVLARDLKKHSGSKVMVEGWLHKKRLLGGLTFINIRDRSGLIQAVVKDKDEVEKLRGLQTGTILRITGLATEEPRAPGKLSYTMLALKFWWLSLKSHQSK